MEERKGEHGKCLGWLEGNGGQSGIYYVVGMILIIWELL